MEIVVAATAEGSDEFQILNAVLDAPRADEILVRIVGVGICHTDIFFRKHGMIPAPAVLGHEGAGIVEQVGAQVNKVAPGDHVVLTFRSCGICARCRSGNPAYCLEMQDLNYAGARCDGSRAIHICDKPAGSNFFGQSSFATHALAYERNVVKVDPDVDLTLIGPLACSIQTGVGAILRSLKCSRGSTIVISGGGAVGMSAVIGARLAGCNEIALVEPIESRRNLALEIGATHVVNPDEVGSLGGKLRELTADGFDFAFDTTGIAKVQNSLIGALCTQGTIGIVGVAAPGTALPGNVNDIVARGLTIRGIIEGDSDPDAFLPFLVDLYKNGELPIDKIVTVFPFESINDAIAAQQKGDCLKAVLAL